MMRAAFYTYTAVPNDLNRDRQESECADEAELAGYEVMAWFHDEPGDRSSLDSLCLGLHAQSFDDIFVRDQSRFGQSFNAVQKVIDAVEAAGVRLVYCNEPSPHGSVTTLFSEITSDRMSIANSR